MRKCNDTYSLDRRTEKSAAGTTLLVLLAAVMIPASVSCDMASLENTPSSPISFDAAPLSKAPVENVDEITGFDVWGWNYSTAGAADAVTVFDRVNVFRQNGGWGYDDVRYWAPERTYDFYALYPSGVAEAGSTTEDEGVPEFSIVDYEALAPDTDGTQRDLMLASATGMVYDPQEAPGGPDKVRLHFTHLLARIDLVCRPYVSQDSWPDGYSPKVYSAKLYGLGKTATFQAGNFDSGNTQSIRGCWTISGQTVTDESCPYADAVITEASIKEETVLLRDVMVFPQSFQPGICFKIEYSASDNALRSSSIIELITLPLEAWEAGRHYVYTFTISPEGRIIFDVPDVQPWDEATGGIIIVE